MQLVSDVRAESTWEVVPVAAQPVLPWANGGGTTRQVAIEPRDGSLQHGFRWRISEAQVASDGPFSLLPGIDRSLWLLGGNGVRLRFAAREVELRHRLQRCDFAGEDVVQSQLLNGACRDLNVMVARERCAARSDIVRWLPSSDVQLASSEQWLLLVLSGALSLATTSLGAGDALRGTGAPPALRGELAGGALFVTFRLLAEVPQ